MISICRRAARVEGRPLPDNCYVITGPPGGGKTPVLGELAALGHGGVPEAAREVLAETGWIDGKRISHSDPALFVELMLARAVADFASVTSSGQPVFFDRAIPDLVVYHEIFGLDPAPAWDAAKTHRYNDIVFVLPPWPEIYTTDEDRTMGFEAAVAFGQRIVDVYESLGYVLVEVPRATPRERASFISHRVAHEPTR